MPSSAEGRSCWVPCFSSRLIFSHCAQTASTLSALESPKTCGWRRMSLSVIVRAAFSKSKAFRSFASWQWKITCSNRSPHSSSISWSSSDSIASISSYTSSTAWKRIDLWSCSRSQGQPPGPRSRAITSTSSSIAGLRFLGLRFAAMSQDHEVIAVDNLDALECAGADLVGIKPADASRELGAIQVADAHNVAFGEIAVALGHAGRQ